MTGHDVRALVAVAEQFADETETTEAVVARLATLEPIQYDRVRESEAQRLDIRISTLDTAVEKERKSRGTDAREFSREPVSLPDPEPWPDPVDGALLLDGLTEVFRKHLVLGPGCAEAIALWIVFTHAHDCFGISPVLGITSPTPECGKTTCLTLVNALVPRALPASNITAAALFRTVEQYRPTVLIDEADTFLRNNDELRGVLNSGHQRASAFVIRTTGDDHEPRQFTTWSPKAIALIGKLPATLASRAIHIELRRKTPMETVQRLRSDRLEQFEPLCRQAARWAADHGSLIRDADPDMPATLHARPADNWRPLIALADAAGGRWPLLARRIAERMTAERTEDTAGIMLLADLRQILTEDDADHLFSADLVAKLETMEDRPWPEWRNGKAITATQLAKLLDPFGIRPGTIRDGGKTGKGYKRAAFEESFARYLPDLSVTPSQTNDSAEYEASPSVTFDDVVTDRNEPKASDSLGCDGVTDRGEKPTEDEDDFFAIPAFLQRMPGRKKVAL